MPDRIARDGGDDTGADDGADADDSPAPGANGPDATGVDDCARAGAEKWAVAGRPAVGILLAREVSDANTHLRDVADKLRTGDDPTTEDVRQARRQLNALRRVVEELVAPAAGVEPWGDPPPHIPMGVMWELTDHPQAEGVEASEYADVEDATPDTEADDE